METFLVPKSSAKYICEVCDYTTSRKSQYDRHLNTRKHKMETNGNNLVPKSSAEFICECRKEYRTRGGLFKHKQKCCNKNEVAQPMVEYLLKENLEMKKENLEMKKLMIDVCKKMEPISNVTNINNINNNKIFNLNLFLNEDCKDAMNMTEFIESIQLTIEEVKKIGIEGQTKALTNILSSKLNSLDIFKRPVHCSDAKKEIIYVKDEDKWELEKKDNPKLKKALDKIAIESLCKIPELSVSDEDIQAKTISEILKDPREDKKIFSKVRKDLILLY